MEEFRLLVVQTGGTIDKDYPKRKGGYSFELCDSGALSVLRKVSPSFPFRLVTACLQDSQDLTDVHRQQILEACQTGDENYVLVTHGTDTILQTAAFLATQLATQSPPASDNTNQSTEKSQASVNQPQVVASRQIDQSSARPDNANQSTERSQTPVNQSQVVASRQIDQSSARPDNANQSTEKLLVDQSQAVESCQSATKVKPASRTMSSAHRMFQKVVVLTGAFLPERFKDTDADFNVGMAVGAMQGGLSPGVYVTLGGRVWGWDRVTRAQNGQYVSV